MSDVQTASLSESQDFRKEPKIRTPLPKLQLFTLFLIQFAEPITATVIYPFIPQFIRNTGITNGDETKIGYYAGIIESTFFISECLSVYHWARASDYFGRRPVLLFGPLGLAFSMFGFGLSSKFWTLVVFRFAQGVFNGNIGVSKTMMAEITDSTNIEKAFSFLCLMWSIGIIVGPLLGGFLSDPAMTWPRTLGKIALLRTFPYFLPCAAAGLLSILCFVFSFFILEESSPSHVKRNKKPTGLLADAVVNDYGATDTGDPPVNTPAERNLSFTELLRNSRVAITMTCYGFLSFCEMSYSALMPLFYSTPIEYGGLGFQPYAIGIIMGSAAILGGLMQILVFSRLMRRFGHSEMFTVSLWCIFIVISCFPLMSFFAKRAGKADAVVVCILVLQLFCATWNFMAYTAIQILVIDSSPTKTSLAGVNGLGQVVACFMRSLSPSIASSLFSISIQHNLLGGNMVYAILLSVLLLAIRVSLFLPKRLQMVE